jgi:hypothetical protein
MSFSPFFIPNHDYSPLYIWSFTSLIARYAIFFITLYRSMLSTLLFRCIQLKPSFFSLIIWKEKHACHWDQSSPWSHRPRTTPVLFTDVPSSTSSWNWLQHQQVPPAQPMPINKGGGQKLRRNQLRWWWYYRHQFLPPSIIFFFFYTGECLRPFK